MELYHGKHLGFVPGQVLVTGHDSRTLYLMFSIYLSINESKSNIEIRIRLMVLFIKSSHKKINCKVVDRNKYFVTWNVGIIRPRCRGYAMDNGRVRSDWLQWRVQGGERGPWGWDGPPERVGQKELLFVRYCYLLHSRAPHSPLELQEQSQGRAVSGSTGGLNDWIELDNLFVWISMTNMLGEEYI